MFLAEKEVGPDLRAFVETGADWVIFTTGIGTETLVNLADKLGIGERYLQAIRGAKAASRGYKTIAALKKLGITPVAADEDGTTKGLIDSLQSHDFSGKRVMVQLHGENAPSLLQFLEEKGAAVFPLLPYRHVAPDRETVALLCSEVINREVDAVLQQPSKSARFFILRKKTAMRRKLSIFSRQRVGSRCRKSDGRSFKRRRS